MIVVYCVKNLINEKRYVGVSNNFAARVRQHESDSKRESTPFYNAIRKYGFYNFTFEILEICKTIRAAYRREKFFIRKLRSHVSYNQGYNVSWGGRGLEGGENCPIKGIKRSKKTLRKQRLIQKKVWERPGEKERRSSLIRLSKQNPEVRRKQSESSARIRGNAKIRRKIILGIRKHHKSRKYRKFMRRIQLRAWADPKKRIERILAMRLGWAARAKRLGELK